MNKDTLRRTLAAARKALTPAEIRERSLRIQEHLIADAWFAGARTIGLYASMGAEVQTQKLIEVAFEQGKRIALPEVLPDGKQMRYVPFSPDDVVAKHVLGFQVPASVDTVPLDELDLIVQPGLGFDLAGHRLGRGGGHYDRLLAQPHRARRVGLAYAFQLVDALPHDPWDVLLHAVATENGVQRTAADHG